MARLKQPERLLRALLLCTLLSGCATYRPAIPGPAIPPVAGADSDTTTIMEGDTAHLVLRSGEALSGKVRWLTDWQLGLGRTGGIGEVVAIDLADIESAEIREQSDSQLEGMWFLSITVMLLTSVYFGLRNLNL